MAGLETVYLVDCSANNQLRDWYTWGPSIFANSREGHPNKKIKMEGFFVRPMASHMMALLGGVGLEIAYVTQMLIEL